MLRSRDVGWTRSSRSAHLLICSAINPHKYGVDQSPHGRKDDPCARQRNATKNGFKEKHYSITAVFQKAVRVELQCNRAVLT
jgi:hypothetical protein